jgi:protein-L-isoaspartate(D-aspartate) O-methyltransferase
VTDRSVADLVWAIRTAGITDPRLLDAIRTTPRADFVPSEHLALACVDQPIPIGHGQMTTQPSLCARMIEGLHLTGNEHVLDVGTGLGFQTALLARLAAVVVKPLHCRIPMPALGAPRRRTYRGCARMHMAPGRGPVGGRSRDLCRSSTAISQRCC